MAEAVAEPDDDGSRADGTGAGPTVTGRVLHVAAAADWAAARWSGRYEISTRGRTLADEGYIHASTGRQVAGVLARYYSDVEPADLVLLVLDADRLAAGGSPVRWGPVATPEGPFPHVHGPIRPEAVVAVRPIGGRAGAAELPAFDDLRVVTGP